MVDIIFENLSKNNYIKSIKSSLTGHKISSKTTPTSDIVTFTIKDENGNFVGEFSRFVNNNRIRELENPTSPEVVEQIRSHDLNFSKSNRLQLKQLNDKS